jgi:hypothetical protein
MDAGSIPIARSRNPGDSICPYTEKLPSIGPKMARFGLKPGRVHFKWTERTSTTSYRLIVTWLYHV